MSRNLKQAIDLIQKQVPDHAKGIFTDMLKARLKGERSQYEEKYSRVIVGIGKFITSPAYLNADEILWDEVLKSLIELNSGDYVEAVLTGAIGVAKTTIALYTTAYQLYLLSCMRNPHKTYGLDPASEIVFVFQSITKELAKGVDYNRFKSMIQASPYFTNNFKFDFNISELPRITFRRHQT